MSELGEKASDALHATGEAIAEVPHAASEAVRKRPRLARAFEKSWPFVRLGLYGAAFFGGGLLLANFLGPRTARKLGRQGGEAFAEGINKVQNQIASVTRGARWG